MVPLKYFLRQKREAIQFTEEFDIVHPQVQMLCIKTESCQHDDYIENPEGFQVNYKYFVRGKLHIRFANIGIKSGGINISYI